MAQVYTLNPASNGRFTGYVLPCPMGITYARKSEAKHENGFIAEDVDKIVPEMVARDPETNQVQGVNYFRFPRDGQVAAAGASITEKSRN
jgi:hypothetical protein